MRDTTFDTPSGPVTIPARAVIYASPGSANRDEAQWGRPSTTSTSPAPTPEATSSSAPASTPASAQHLARMQAEAMFTAILDRFDDLELAGDPVWSTRMVIRGLNRLPVRASLRA